MNFEPITSDSESAEGQMCPHGNPANSECGECSLAKKEADTPLMRAVQRMAESSKFKRGNIDSPNCDLERERIRYKAEIIEKGENPDLSKVQQLFIKVFGAEEVDPEEILRNAVDGTTAFGTEDITKYQICVVKDSKGEVVSVVAGGLLELMDDKGIPTGETVFMIGYAVTDPDIRQSGLAREAYISSIIGANKDAEAQGKKLSFAAGECTYTSEEFWNKVGWKRVYAAESPGEKKSYRELKYIQPALEFDESTGGVAEGAGEAPEHLMIDSFNRMPPDKEQLAQTINAFYRWCNYWPRESFESDEAYQKQNMYVKKIEDQFREDLENSGQLIFLDKQSREKAITRGVGIEEYKEADRGKTGEEDF